MPNGNGSPKGQRNARSNLCAETQPGSKSLTQIKQIEQIKKLPNLCKSVCYKPHPGSFCFSSD